jgi:hypothetical protein
MSGMFTCVGNACTSGANQAYRVAGSVARTGCNIISSVAYGTAHIATKAYGVAAPAFNTIGRTAANHPRITTAGVVAGGVLLAAGLAYGGYKVYKKYEKGDFNNFTTQAHTNWECCQDKAKKAWTWTSQWFPVAQRETRSLNQEVTDLKTELKTLQENAKFSEAYVDNLTKALATKLHIDQSDITNLVDTTKAKTQHDIARAQTSGFDTGNGSPEV